MMFRKSIIIKSYALKNQVGLTPPLLPLNLQKLNITNVSQIRDGDQINIIDSEFQ